MGRAVPQRGEHRPSGHRQVVLDEFAFGACRAQFREINLVGVGEPDRDPVHVEFLCCGRHIRIPTRRGRERTPRRENESMELPVMPPVSPMLAKSVRSIPPDASYEPKWDGFRSICFRDVDEVELGSRNERPLTRYFPELVTAVKAELPERCVIDGETVIATDHGLDFAALQQRIHPAA